VEELVATAQQGWVDFLIVDLLGVPDASARCRTIIGRTALPIHICHPDREFVEDLQPQSHGKLYWLPPSWAGLSLLEKVRTLLGEAALANQSTPAVPALTTPEPTGDALRRSIARALTDEQRTILRHLADGLRHKEIAAAMGLSASTLGRDVAALQDLFKVSSTNALCVAAGRLGFV